MDGRAVGPPPARAAWVERREPPAPERSVPRLAIPIRILSSRAPPTAGVGHPIRSCAASTASGNLPGLHAADRDRRGPRPRLQAKDAGPGGSDHRPSLGEGSTALPEAPRALGP